MGHGFISVSDTPCALGIDFIEVALAAELDAIVDGVLLRNCEKARVRLCSFFRPRSTLKARKAPAFAPSCFIA